MVKNEIASTKMPSGRHPYRHDQRTLKLRDIINKRDRDKKIPAQYNWGHRIKPTHNWGDYGNLKLNNCTFVSAASLIMIWKSYKEEKIYRPGVKTIIDDYSKLIKDNRKGGLSINTILKEGGKPLEAVKVLNHWRKAGIDGHKIIAYAKLTFNNKKEQKEELKRTIYLYGGCYIGLNIPRSVEKQWQQNKKWTILRGVSGEDARLRLWFRHALVVIGYNEKELRVVTFGKEEILSWDFFEKYVDEAYAVFEESFLKARNTPSKMKMKDLKDILKIKIKKRRVLRSSKTPK